MTAQERLEGKCNQRIMVDLKAIKGFPLSNQDCECLYHCNGYNYHCLDYAGLRPNERLETFSRR